MIKKQKNINIYIEELYELYKNTSLRLYSISNELGYLQIVGNEPNRIEIRNRVWLEVNKNRISNLSLQLFADFDNDGIADSTALGNVVTDTNGECFFNEINVLDGAPRLVVTQAGLQANTYLFEIEISIDASNFISE